MFKRRFGNPDQRVKMDALPDSPPPTLREVYLTFATMVGFLGILLLAGYSFAVYQTDSLASLGFLFPLAIFGVAAMVVCGTDVVWCQLRQHLGVQCCCDRVDLRNSCPLFARGKTACRKALHVAAHGRNGTTDTTVE